jgi:hypothetical protein
MVPQNSCPITSGGGRRGLRVLEGLELAAADAARRDPQAHLVGRQREKIRLANFQPTKLRITQGAHETAHSVSFRKM